MPSSTVEDYLKCIYLASREDPKGWVLMGRLAGDMQVQPGTATTMVKTLAESGLAEYVPYKGVTLTRQGHKLALHIVRRHRLVELFLVQVMGLDWSCVHDDAEQLEHAVSERVIARMDEMLGHPAVDPHGDEIPTAAGELAEIRSVPVSRLAVGRAARLVRVLDQRPEFLTFLGEHGLKPGIELSVSGRSDMTGNTTLRVGEHEVSLATAVADHLLAEPL